MIKIKDEESQKLFGITNGCTSCSSNKFKDGIKVIKIIPRYGGNGIEVTLCRKCREELKDLLSQ